MQVKLPSNVSKYDPPEADAQAFIDEHDLWPWIGEACQLIDACFDIGGNVAIAKATDPELADEWVALHIAAKGETEEVLDAYDAFTRGIVRILPPDVGRKVRLFGRNGLMFDLGAFFLTTPELDKTSYICWPNGGIIGQLSGADPPP